MYGRKERLREDELFRLLHQIADALDYVHGRAGSNKEDAIAHRSLKLNNILIGKGKPGIEVYLSDFGLCKIVGPGAVVCRSFKAMAETLGSLPIDSSSKVGEDKYFPAPVEAGKIAKLTLSFLQNYAFLAPEQKRFEPSLSVGAPADIFAFGILTYYLIAGIFPEGCYDRPSQLAPEYLFDWDCLVDRCLQYRPERRPTLLLPLLEEIKKSSPTPSSAHFVPLTFPKMEEPEIVEVAVEPAKIEVSRAFEMPPEAPSMVAEVKPELEEKMVGLLDREPIVKEYQPEKREKRNSEPILTESFVIPAGHYFRGSNEGNRDEMPRHQVYLPAFAIDIHPVTNEQFARFLEYTGGEKDANYHDLIRLKDSRIKRIAGKLSIESGYAKHPVVGVTWYGAVAYAAWVGKRLPTEAEWEIAALGGHDHCLYPTGETIEKSQANFFSSDTTAVMSYAPNEYRLYDIVGNVYEWCQDWYGYNYYETSALEPHNPKGPVQGVYRVLRGGCWKSLKEDLRCSHRHRNNPAAVNGTYGFRCAADV